MKKIISLFIGVSTVVSSFMFVLPVFAVAPTFDTTGSYVVNLEYLGTDYPTDITLVQDAAGNLTGNGGSPAGANVYLWTITSGTVSGNAVTLTADYTATADAVIPQATINVSGLIAPDGTLSGTWSDNYAGGERSGTWNTVSGAAAVIPLGETLVAEDFGVVSYDTGVGTLSGYSAGFGLTNATFTGAQSVVVKLYSGTTLLQTNTAIIPKFNADITSTQMSSPFDVFGTFNYLTDGYWTNVRESEYGQTVPATKVVATVTLQNGNVVTAQNTTLTGEVIGSGGVLEVTSIDMVDTSATDNSSFEDGWKYVFHITAPANEPNLAMKFSDWLHNSNGSIPVASNMRISSLQADNGGVTILLTGTNLYSTPDLHMTSDLNPLMAGRQVEITVEVAIPNGTPDGNYSTSYGVRSNP